MYSFFVHSYQKTAIWNAYS